MDPTEKSKDFLNKAFNELGNKNNAMNDCIYWLKHSLKEHPDNAQIIEILNLLTEAEKKSEEAYDKLNAIVCQP